MTTTSIREQLHISFPQTDLAIGKLHPALVVALAASNHNAHQKD
jgi:hypothetical protein